MAESLMSGKGTPGHRVVSGFLALWVLAAGVTAWMVHGQGEAPPVLPAEPTASPVTVVRVQPFVLERPATHWYRAERPAYAAGAILVLEVDPDLAHRRQGYEPVLFAGAETLERINDGSASGYQVVVLPAPMDADGVPILDLVPVFFGAPALPEEITALDAARARDKALAAGVASPSMEVLHAVTRPMVTLEDAWDLAFAASYVIEEFSPTERDLIDGLRVPRLGR